MIIFNFVVVLSQENTASGFVDFWNQPEMLTMPGLAFSQCFHEGIHNSPFSGVGGIGHDSWSPEA